MQLLGQALFRLWERAEPQPLAGPKRGGKAPFLEEG